MADDVALQAGAIPYRASRDGGVEVLIVSTSSGRWSTPKGFIDPGRSAEETASIEALEEAGVIGTLEEEVGTFEYERAGRLHSVRTFVLRVERVLEHWQEEGERERRWVSVEEARECAFHPELGALIGRAGAAIRKRGSGRRSRGTARGG